ncbi:Ccc1 family [Paraphoma chrysanthemicola]|uniref:Ccc1 family n=1 Tax=Paraphoma chrysanthemicola TaxID=798071 RepID=A0A8K0RID1_9PLEO|nr:Ccc1 family [Paraphoma chrysanthemicola]
MNYQTVGPERKHEHTEHHKSHSEVLRDAIIGFADGLTVPFALTAGLSAAGSSHIVIIGGTAELFAGAISMGLGAWLAAKTEAKHYHVEEERERREVREMPEAEEEEIYAIFDKYGVSRGSVVSVVEALKKDEDMWVQFMMDFELQLAKPAVSRAWISALVMGLTYLLGGLIPMIPYFAFQDVNHALFTSIGITFVLLVVFGYIKALLTGSKLKDIAGSIVQTVAVGAIAAGTSYGIVRGITRALDM